MNRIIFTIVCSFMLASAIGQAFQGTIKPGTTSTSVICAIRPTGNYSDKPSNIQFTIAIPQSVGTRPTASILTNNYSSLFTTTALIQTATYLTDYVYLVNMFTPTLTTTKNYTTNTEETVVEVAFTGNVGDVSQIRLVQLPNGSATSGAGSENGNYNFYTEFATGSDKTNTAAMFYSTTGGTVVNNPLGYAGYSSVSAGSAVVPLKWLNFSAQKQNGNALVKWEVANQVNNDYFEVEVSNDGRNFNSIGKVTATDKTIYSYVDVNLAKVAGAYAYYRIRQVDKDGKFSYSEIKKLQVSGKDFAFSIIGNPVRGTKLNIGIQSPVSSKGVIQIIDLKGKQVYQSNVTWVVGYSQQSLDIPYLASGTYTANLITGSEKYQVKFVK